MDAERVVCRTLSKPVQRLRHVKKAFTFKNGELRNRPLHSHRGVCCSSDVEGLAPHTLTTICTNQVHPSCGVPNWFTDVRNALRAFDFKFKPLCACVKVVDFQKIPGSSFLQDILKPDPQSILDTDLHMPGCLHVWRH